MRRVHRLDQDAVRTLGPVMISEHLLMCEESGPRYLRLWQKLPPVVCRPDSDRWHTYNRRPQPYPPSQRVRFTAENAVIAAM